MFTGIIENRGTLKNKVASRNMYKLIFDLENTWDDITLGESIAVNGVCLTVTEFSNRSFSADVSIPTLQDTTLSKLSINSIVNLERSLRLGDRFGGHIVQGHVDGVGRVVSSIKKDDNLIIKITAGRKLLDLIILKASIAIDGVSLTVQGVDLNDFTLVIIPHSAKKTTLEKLRIGSEINIEVDMFAKYSKYFLTQYNETDKDIDLRKKIDSLFT